LRTVKPLDLVFLALESASRPMHMAAYALFEMPASYRGDYIHDLVDAFRASSATAPFDRRLGRSRAGIAQWDATDVDMRHHVRHLAVPRPGRADQLSEILAFLNASPLDRAYPLWECYVIEGIEHDRFAIFLKIHHALMDGVAAMKLFESALSGSSAENLFRAPWEPHRRRPRTHKEDIKPRELRDLLRGVGAIGGQVRNVGAEVSSVARDLLRMRLSALPLPFGAAPSQLNTPTGSASRRCAACDLPLDTIRRIASSGGATVNEVVITAIDAALHRYLDEAGGVERKPLVALMPLSLTTKGSGRGADDQIGVLPVKLGAQDAALVERLRQVMDSSGRVKDNAAQMPGPLLQVYTIMLVSGGFISESRLSRGRLATINLAISNMPGPRKPLYLHGAPLAGLYVLPIVPPGAGLNITFLSYADRICVTVAATPDAIDDPSRVAELVVDALDELDAAFGEAAGERRDGAKTGSKGTGGGRRRAKRG
jgi:WS/DGAT/MGAT family acyltransferase